MQRLAALSGALGSIIMAPGFTAILFAAAIAGFKNKAIPGGLAWFSVVMLAFVLLISLEDVVRRAIHEDTCIKSLGASYFSPW